LKGIDPFLTEDINYANGVKLYKKDIFKMVGFFDMIMLNHSFEHMENPKNILEQINRLLKPNSIALIRIPVSNSFAWKKYGKNWVNLDPPRHFFLHNYKTISLLAKRTNFVIEKVIYDSDECQFWVSEQYAKGIPMHNEKSYYKGSKTLFNSKQIKSYKLQAEKLNKEGLGDKACFYLKKI
jgi:SAM-dependent methyltransferase